MKSLEDTKGELLQLALDKVKADAQVPINETLKEALKEILEDAKVPMHVHLQVLEALGKRVKEHDETMAQSKKDSDEAKELVSKYAEHIDFLRENHQKDQASWEAKWEESKNHILSIDHLKGDQGDPGLDAPIVNEEALAQSILERLIPLIPEPLEGNPGKDAEEGKIVTLVLEKIKKEKSLDLSHIKGAQSFIKDGIRYKFEELMHGGGKSTGGSSGYQVPTAGAVNGSNNVFTWATAPNVIVLDNGNAMNKVSSDGTVNWTGTTTTTLNQSPNFNIYATA